MSFIIRPAKTDDLQPLYEMAKRTGGGFTNLPRAGQLVRSEARVASGPINWRKDGTAPTTVVGVPAFDGDVFQLDRYEVVRFQPVRQG